MKGKPTEQRLQELASKWLNKTITADEKKEFAAWYNSDQDHDVKIPPEFAENEEILEDRILYKINGVIKPNKNRIPLKTWLSIAASLLLLIGFSAYYFTRDHNIKTNQVATLNKNNGDIKPGSNKAILTLANGSTINLSDVKNGVLTNQGKTLLKKNNAGQITYQGSAKTEDQSLIYNTITVPKGGQFQIALSDSTKVWLNSASSVTFPVAFSKTERKITVTGEVYLEVAKNKHLPFRVVAGKQVIEVLGTHFNINAYTDESAIITTLVEGSVKVTANGNIAILKPNQQSSVSNNDTQEIRVTTADEENALAWKNGVFQFDNTEMPTIMREISRWYDVQIKYEGQYPQRNFTGSISRNVNLSELLNMLKYTGVDFKTQGHTITVIN